MTPSLTDQKDLPMFVKDVARHDPGVLSRDA